jgi:two-component system, NarL family, invasion response regulator UvrY
MSSIYASMTLTEAAGERNTITEGQIRVLIVDDHPGVRAGLKKLLGPAKDVVVVGEGENGADAIDLVNTKNGDILLLDIELPDQRGDIVMQRIHETKPEMKVLTVSSYSDVDYILGMVENGASGYITKDEAPRMLIDAIRSIVREGKNWLSPRAIKNSGLTPVEEQILTEREVHILECLIQDQSELQIADALGMDEKQVGKYVTLLMKKFETESLDVLKNTAHRIFSRREA